MKEVILKTTKRKAIPYIINLKCDCGGYFVKINPIQFNYQTQTIKHQCVKCNKIIDCKTIYPQSVNISDDPEEDYGQDTVFEDIITEIGL